MRRILEQKWLTYLEIYGGQWTPRQMDNARTLFYAGATSFWQGLMADIESKSPSDDAELTKLVASMDALHMELEEFAAGNKSRS